MRVIDNLAEIRQPFPRAVVTIGNFDGVHIGHQALFHTVTEKAETIGGTAVVLTFEPHPVRVLTHNGYPPLITLRPQKIELIEKAGIDVLVSIPFTREFAAVSARSFVIDILLAKLGVTVLVVGQDYRFGKNREGNLNLLRSYAEAFDFEVVVVDWVPMSADIPFRVSSTRIRELVMAGAVDDAQKLLGRFYQIRGRVTTGRQRGGRLLGFPTANIALSDELCPKAGIYAVKVEWSGRLYNGVANIGYSPTFDDNDFTVEVHLMDFNESIYEQEIRINFVRRIRDEVKFENLSALSEQIGRDVSVARDILTGSPSA